MNNTQEVVAGSIPARCWAALAVRLRSFEDQARAAIKPTGWSFSRIAFNPRNGFFKVMLVRRNETDGSVRTMTVLRSTYSSSVTVVREVQDVREGLYGGRWLDSCNSFYMGRDSFPHIGAAMLNCAIYISDNPAPGHISIEAKTAMRLLAGMSHVGQEQQPNTVLDSSGRGEQADSRRSGGGEGEGCELD